MALFSVLNFIIYSAFIAIFGASLIKVIFAADTAMADGLETLPERAFEPLRMAVIYAVILCVCVVLKRIIKLIAVFKIYLRFAPNVAVVFIIFSILIPVLEPIFLFSIRENEIKECTEDAKFNFEE